jgi:hypothetical protein
VTWRFRPAPELADPSSADEAHSTCRTAYRSWQPLDLLAGRFRLAAPDDPGFGHSGAPGRPEFARAVGHLPASPAISPSLGLAQCTCPAELPFSPSRRRGRATSEPARTRRTATRTGGLAVAFSADRPQGLLLLQQAVSENDLDHRGDRLLAAPVALQFTGERDPADRLAAGLHHPVEARAVGLG